jgi:hypothetical protein
VLVSQDKRHAIKTAQIPSENLTIERFVGHNLLPCTANICRIVLEIDLTEVSNLSFAMQDRLRMQWTSGQMTGPNMPPTHVCKDFSSSSAETGREGGEENATASQSQVKSLAIMSFWLSLTSSPARIVERENQRSLHLFMSSSLYVFGFSQYHACRFSLNRCSLRFYSGLFKSKSFPISYMNLYLLLLRSISLPAHRICPSIAVL